MTKYKRPMASLSLTFRYVMCMSVTLALPTALAARPVFSWDTLPVFFHSSNQSGPYSQESIKVIAKYPMVTIEKWQSIDVKTIDDEDAMVQFMQAVKAVNPNVSTYFYMDAWKDRPEMTRMNRELLQHPEWMLRDENGDPVIFSRNKYYVFDQSNPEVQEWWQHFCLNATKYGSGDGCYCDASQHVDQVFPGVSPEKQKAWGQGILNLTRQVEAALGPDKCLIGKEPNQSYVRCAQIEFFYANNDSINALLLGVAKGKVMQAHVPVEVSCLGDLSDYLAAFLIGAGEYSYFGCGNWFSSGNSTKAFYWHPDYDKPLGTPTPAVYQDRVWKRQFSSGTSVTFDTTTNKGFVYWAT